MDGKKYDVIVLGAGILGAMIARQLSRYRLKILVLEREGDLGEGATKANSGILYAGFHPRGGSLKGIACARGNEMYTRLCAELDVPMRRTGSLFVAFHPEGEEKIREKYEKGLKNGVPGMEILSGAEARRLEPLLSGRVTQALYAPTTGILSPFALIWAVARSAAENGVEFAFGTEVTGVTCHEDGIAVQTTRGEYAGDFLVNAAGESAAVIEGWLHPQDLVIKPRRGQYYIFDKHEPPLLRHVLYQAQESDEGGTLLAPTIDGNLIAGPTSDNVPSFRHKETTAEGLAHVERVARKLLPELDMGQVITNFAGVRANIVNVAKEHKDFVVRRSARHVVSLLGIKNPGMTCAPYLAALTEEKLREEGLRCEAKRDFRPTPERQRPFLQETPERQRELFAQDPRYARVVCRCEGITEGDILHILRGPLPPSTLNGLKKRLRVGMGRCQGGFCTPRVLEIMARETGISPERLLKDRVGSVLIKGKVRNGGAFGGL